MNNTKPFSCKWRGCGLLWHRKTRQMRIEMVVQRIRSTHAALNLLFPSASSASSFVQIACLSHNTSRSSTVLADLARRRRSCASGWLRYSSEPLRESQGSVGGTTIELPVGKPYPSPSPAQLKIVPTQTAGYITRYRHLLSFVGLVQPRSICAALMMQLTLGGWLSTTAA